jgi:hypothetical protein
MTAPIASGWSDCRVGFAPTGKRRLAPRSPGTVIAASRILQQTRSNAFVRYRLSWQSNEKGGSKMKGKLISIFVGIFIAVVSWVPLWIVEAYDRYAMPVGLGLFAFAASFVGGVIALVGLIRLVIHSSRASN